MVASSGDIRVLERRCGRPDAQASPNLAGALIPLKTLPPTGAYGAPHGEALSP